jgi:iduronate 2-sulfatase
MNRFLRLVALVLCGLPVRGMAAEPKMNVLFIAVDDLRPELGCYGLAHMKSPNIDALAARGLLFERAYCQVAVCNASRNSLLSGCRPDTTRIFNNQTFLRPTMPDVLTLPQHFKNSGWYTMSLGKIFHHSEREPGDDPQSWSEPAWYHGEQYRSWFTKEALDYVKNLKALPKEKQPKIMRGPPFEAANEPDDVYPDGQTAAKTIETLQRLKGTGQPFFLGVGFVKPHLPFTCPQKYWDLYPAETVQLPDNYYPPKDVPAPALHDGYELRTYGTVPAKGEIPREMALNLIRGYRACVSFMDAQVGRVLAELDRLGLRDNTVVILWGDHGYHLGENGLFTKMTNFELGTHAPLIVSVPGQKTAGQRTKALVEFVDIYPTLAELCGLTQPAHLEGTSFAPLLAKPDQAWKTAAFSQYERPGKEKFMGRSIRTDRWRYTEWTTAADALAGAELYDEQADPKENVNLAGDASHRPIAVELAQKLHAGWKAALPATAKIDVQPVPVAIATASPKGDVTIANFEGDAFDGWTATGEAFGGKPYRPGAKQRLSQFEGQGVAWSGGRGVESKGALLSPEFRIERRFINYLIEGARDLPAVLGAELLVDGRVVRAGSATEGRDPSHSLYRRTWDVTELAGRTARIRVNDQSAGGAVAVDQFEQSDTAKGVPADATVLGVESHRPQFHYTVLTGWQNDANGLLYYKGDWHLFHQHRPPPGDRIVWGHAVSKDLLHWQRWPTAIAGDDGDAAASGSGVIDWENASGLKHGDDPPILLFFTDMPPAGGERKATQCMAVSTDGLRTIEKFAGNPLLRTPATRDRDPKVFFHQPTRTWIMALSLSRNNADREHATYGLFRSKDLKSWELFQELGPGAWYWECPDMFELPVDGDRGRTKWIFMKGSGDYLIGTFDGQRFTAEAGPIRTHWGGSFYGGQTFEGAPDGRRVHIAWMSTGKDGPSSWPGMPFNQQMSFPRELTLRTTPEGPRLFREPIAEIAQLYAKSYDLKMAALNPGDNPLADIHHDLLDVDMDVEIGAAGEVKLNLRGEEIVYDVKGGKLKVRDRALSLAPLDGRLVLRILLDRTSIELFANRGEVTHSIAFFPDPANHQIALNAEGGAAKVPRLVVRELKPSMLPPP